jgi:hypothetical protein
VAFLAGGRRPYRGRVRVLGGGPGCLVMSLALSIALTVLVNVAISLF